MSIEKKVNSALLKVCTYCYYASFVIVTLLALSCGIAFIAGFADIAIRLADSVGDFINAMVVFMVLIMWTERSK